VYPITISNWKKEFIEKAFRDIYGEGIMYGGEASIWSRNKIFFLFLKKIDAYREVGINHY